MSIRFLQKSRRTESLYTAKILPFLRRTFQDRCENRRTGLLRCTQNYYGLLDRNLAWRFGGLGKDDFIEEIKFLNLSDAGCNILAYTVRFKERVTREPNFSSSLKRVSRDHSLSSSLKEKVSQDHSLNPSL
jgi:hypothetical protein